MNPGVFLNNIFPTAGNRQNNSKYNKSSYDIGRFKALQCEEAILEWLLIQSTLDRPPWIFRMATQTLADWHVRISSKLMWQPSAFLEIWRFQNAFMSPKIFFSSHLNSVNIRLFHKSNLNLESSTFNFRLKKDNSILGRKCPLAKFKSFTFMQNIRFSVRRILSNIYPHIRMMYPFQNQFRIQIFMLLDIYVSYIYMTSTLINIDTISTKHRRRVE